MKFGGGGSGHASRATSFFTPSGKTGSIFSFTHFSDSTGRQLEVGRALGEDLDEGEALALDLEPERLLDRLLGLHAVLRVEERHPLDVDRPVEPRDQLRHLERLAGEAGAAVGAGRSSSGP